MTVIDKDRAFWTLQEVFDYIRSSAAVNWDALRLILEAQRQVFASYVPRIPLHSATALEEFPQQAKLRRLIETVAITNDQYVGTNFAEKGELS